MRMQETVRTRTTPQGSPLRWQQPSDVREERLSTPPVAERWYSEKRLGGLSRFAVAITVLNVLGHAFLGFEQSWVTPFVALLAAYGTELVGEAVESRFYPNFK